MNANPFEEQFFKNANPFEELNSKLDKILELTEMKQEDQVKEEPLDDEMDVEECARLLQRSLSWVYSHTKSTCPDRLPHRKFGLQLIFSRKQIIEWMQKRNIIINVQ